MSTITPKELQPKLTADPTLKLIDVRTSAEYDYERAVGAVNVPLNDFDAAAVIRQHGLSNEQPVYLICKMGGRSQKACDQLRAAGLTSVVNVTGGTDRWIADQLPAIKREGEKAPFAIHRQVQLLAGGLALAGALLSFVHPRWALLSAFIGAGLMFSGLTNTCGMASVLGQMPWNRPKKSATGCDTGG